MPLLLPLPVTRLLIVCCATLLVATVSARPAFAQDQATIDRLVQLNKKAMDDYDTADFDTAKKSLLDAERTGKRAGLETHPVMARTYIHLGALYLVGFKDKQKAQHYFGKALDIQPDINLDRTLTSASVRDVFAAVKAQKGEGGDDEAPPPPPPPRGRRRGQAVEPVPAEPLADTGTEASPPRRQAGAGRAEAAIDDSVEPELPATVTALDCPYPDDTPPGRKITLRCVAAPSLGVENVTLHYKGQGMSDYQAVPMTKSEKGWWQATVPKKRVDGKSLQFYFEGLNASDRPVVSNGRAQSPNVLLIVERGNRVATGPRGEEENPLEESNASTPKLLLGKYDESRIGVDARFGNRRFWIGLGIGTGAAYPLDGVPESRVGSLANQTPDVKITGIGWAGIGQLAPEIGFQINPNWAISLEGRNQFILQSKRAANYTASGAHAVLLKVMHYTKQQRLRGFYGVAAGGGEGARMNIQTDFPMNPDLKDTVLIGPVLFGGTAGIYYEISKKFSWIAETNVLFGAGKKGFVFDFNTGIQMNFGDTSGAAEAAAAKKKGSVSTSIDDEEPQ